MGGMMAYYQIQYIPIYISSELGQLEYIDLFWVPNKQLWPAYAGVMNYNASIMTDLLACSLKLHSYYAPVNWIPGRGGPGNGRAMPGLSCLVHQNAAPQGGDITN